MVLPQKCMHYLLLHCTEKGESKYQIPGIDIIPALGWNYKDPQRMLYWLPANNVTQLRLVQKLQDMETIDAAIILDNKRYEMKCYTASEGQSDLRDQSCTDANFIISRISGKIKQG